MISLRSFKTSRLNPWKFASVMLLTVGGGCMATTAKVEVVKDRKVIEVKENETAAPIQFRKIVIKMKRGEDIGSIQTGLFCVAQSDLLHRGSRAGISGDELTEVFQEELKSANYEVVGDPSALFEDPTAWKAEYLVAGLVTNMRANICYQMAGWGNYSSGTGEASMEVEWQVYSRLTRKIVHKVKSKGHAKISDSRTTIITDVFLDAFAQASRNLLADEGFHDLITGIKTQEAAKGLAPENTLVISNIPLFTEPMQKNVNDVRLGVVTVFAGDGHGSGFFIDKRGYLLTNEHVVREAKFVKMKLSIGREILGEVVSVDVKRDIALIKSEPIGIPGLPIRLSSPSIGSTVFAMGAPRRKQLSATLSQGILSAFRLDKNQPLIQSDVNILQGNSGGPLMDENGNVIGVSVSGLMLGRERSPTGLNFFIPIGSALEALQIEVGDSPNS